MRILTCVWMSMLVPHYDKPLTFELAVAPVTLAELMHLMNQSLPLHHPAFHTTTSNQVIAQLAAGEWFTLP